jgi:hypothetical protein
VAGLRRSATNQQFPFAAPLRMREARIVSPEGRVIREPLRLEHMGRYAPLMDRDKTVDVVMDYETPNAVLNLFIPPEQNVWPHQELALELAAQDPNMEWRGQVLPPEYREAAHRSILLQDAIAHGVGVWATDTDMMWTRHRDGRVVHPHDRAARHVTYDNLEASTVGSAMKPYEGARQMLVMDYWNVTPQQVQQLKPWGILFKKGVVHSLHEPDLRFGFRSSDFRIFLRRSRKIPQTGLYLSPRRNFIDALHQMSFGALALTSMETVGLVPRLVLSGLHRDGIQPTSFLRDVPMIDGALLTRAIALNHDDYHRGRVAAYHMPERVAANVVFEAAYFSGLEGMPISEANLSQAGMHFLNILSDLEAKGFPRFEMLMREATDAARQQAPYWQRVQHQELHPEDLVVILQDEALHEKLPRFADVLRRNADSIVGRLRPRLT